MKKLNQSGFGAIEAILIVVIVAIIGGTGYYVYHANKQTDKAANNASSSNIESSKTQATSSKTTAPANTPKYLTIKEWGIRAPYSGSDSFSYIISTNNTATVISQKLKTKYGCTDMGAGMIQRLNPNESTSADVHIGNYYYKFVHDQATCSETVKASQQNEANNTVKSIVPKLESTQ